MARKLLLAGFLLIASGLALLALTDPTLRVLIFGASSLSNPPAGTSFNRSNLASIAGRSAFSSAAASSRLLVYAFAGFGMATVGLVLAISGFLTQ